MCATILKDNYPETGHGPYSHMFEGFRKQILEGEKTVRLSHLIKTMFLV